MSRVLKNIFYALVTVFAVVGLAFTVVFIAMQFGLLNVRGSILERNAFFTSGQEIPAEPCIKDGASTCDWKETPEWVVVAGGLTKDAELIKQVSTETGVSARLMTAVVIPEQIRFFTSEREVFKRYFEPLKILGSLTQFSLGVSGIKQETAEQIELHASDASSPFYPGPELAKLIEYAPGVNQKTELFNRLTDDTNHYYSYLYTALYLKEVEAQWERAGFGLQGRPEILVTLFNIGFANSRPGPSPEVGGAPIEVGGNVYSFGDLGGRFFRSDELRDLFPN